MNKFCKHFIANARAVVGNFQKLKFAKTALPSGYVISREKSLIASVAREHSISKYAWMGEGGSTKRVLSK